MAAPPDGDTGVHVCTRTVMWAALSEVNESGLVMTVSSRAEQGVPGDPRLRLAAELLAHGGTRTEKQKTIAYAVAAKVILPSSSEFLMSVVSKFYGLGDLNITPQSIVSGTSHKKTIQVVTSGGGGGVARVNLDSLLIPVVFRVGAFAFLPTRSSVLGSPFEGTSIHMHVSPRHSTVFRKGSKRLGHPYGSTCDSALAARLEKNGKIRVTGVDITTTLTMPLPMGLSAASAVVVTAVMTVCANGEPLCVSLQDLVKQCMHLSGSALLEKTADSKPTIREKTPVVQHMWFAVLYVLVTKVIKAPLVSDVHCRYWDTIKGYFFELNYSPENRFDFKIKDRKKRIDELVTLLDMFALDGNTHVELDWEKLQELSEQTNGYEARVALRCACLTYQPLQGKWRLDGDPDLFLRAVLSTAYSGPLEVTLTPTAAVDWRLVSDFVLRIVLWRESNVTLEDMALSASFFLGPVSHVNYQKHPGVWKNAFVNRWASRTLDDLGSHIVCFLSYGKVSDGSTIEVAVLKCASDAGLDCVNVSVTMAMDARAAARMIPCAKTAVLLYWREFLQSHAQRVVATAEAGCSLADLTCDFLAHAGVDEFSTVWQCEDGCQSSFPVKLIRDTACFFGRLSSSLVFVAMLLTNVDEGHRFMVMFKPNTHSIGVATLTGIPLLKKMGMVESTVFVSMAVVCDDGVPDAIWLPDTEEPLGEFPSENELIENVPEIACEALPVCSCIDYSGQKSPLRGFSTMVPELRRATFFRRGSLPPSAGYRWNGRMFMVFPKMSVGGIIFVPTRYKDGSTYFAPIINLPIPVCDGKGKFVIYIVVAALKRSVKGFQCALLGNFENGAFAPLLARDFFQELSLQTGCTRREQLRRWSLAYVLRSNLVPLVATAVPAESSTGRPKKRARKQLPVPRVDHSSPGYKLHCACERATSVPLSRILADNGQSIASVLIAVTREALGATNAPPPSSIHRGVEFAAPLFSEFGIKAYSYENRRRYSTSEDVSAHTIDMQNNNNKTKLRSMYMALRAVMMQLSSAAQGLLSHADKFGDTTGLSRLAAKTRLFAMPGGPGPDAPTD